MGHIWPKWPKRAIYGPCGHDHRPNQYVRYGYPGKEQTNTNTTIQISALLDIIIKSYGCFTVLSQNYIVKMAILDQKYRHWKELSYREFKHIFGNGMACGQRWQHGKTQILTLVFIRITLHITFSHVLCLKPYPINKISASKDYVSQESTISTATALHPRT